MIDGFAMRAEAWWERVNIMRIIPNNTDLGARILDVDLSRASSAKESRDILRALGNTACCAFPVRSSMRHSSLVGALGSHALNVGLYRNLPVHPLIGLDHITISSESAMVVAAPGATGWALAERPGPEQGDAQPAMRHRRTGL